MKKLFSKVVPNKAINEEIQTGVENAGEMRDMSQANNPFCRKKRVWGFTLMKQLIAMNYAFNMRELPDINNHTGSVAANESDNYAKQN